MRGLRKKAVALAAVAAMVMTSLVGCAGSVKNSDVVATVGDTEITAGIANFYIRLQQVSIESYYQSYLGEDMWKTEVSEGVTYEDSIKDSVMESLQELYILRDHMDDYEVSLTEDEQAAIDEAAKAFAEANTDEAKEKISGDKEIVAEVLELMTISEKMHDAIIAEVDTEVSDDEAAQKAMQYVLYETSITSDDGTTTEMSEDEIAAQKTAAEDFLTNAKANGSLETYATEAGVESQKATFDAESTSPDADLVAAADALGEGEFTEVIETDAGYYVAQVTSLFDREATDAEKETIVSERQEEHYTEVVDGWKEEVEITVNEKVWAKISLQGLQVTEKTVEEETDTTETTEDTDATDDTTSTDETEDTTSTDTVDDSTATDEDVTTDSADTTEE